MVIAADAGYRDNVASHRIAESLRTAILDGSYRPGERIRQEDVAARWARAGSRSARRCGCSPPKGS